MTHLVWFANTVFETVPRKPIENLKLLFVVFEMDVCW